MLEAIAAKYSSSYHDVVLAKVVLYAAEGLSNKAIAARIDLPRQIVCRWRKRFYEEGLPGLHAQREPDPPFHPHASGPRGRTHQEHLLGGHLPADRWYEELGVNYYDERKKAAVVHNAVKRLERVGYHVAIEPAA